MFLIDAFEYQARVQPHAVALIHGRMVLRYGELAAVVRKVAAMLAGRGLGPGDVVGITMGNSPLHLVTLLALSRLAAVSVAVHPLLSNDRKKAVIDEYQVTAVLTNQGDAGVEGVPIIVMDASWMEPGKGADPRWPDPASGDVPWRIGLSSGTTGRPKGVMRTQGQTLSLVLLHQTVIEIGPGARFLVLMDLNLTANLLRVLRHLLTGSAIVFPRTVTDLDSVLEAIDRHGVTHTLVSPSIAGKWARALPVRGPRAPTLAHLAVAGGRMTAHLKQEITERLTPNIYMNYGTTETGPIAAADPAMHQRFPDCVGRVVPWARAQIVDPQDEPVPAGQPGIVRLRSVGAADGYYRNADASKATFRNGWVYPGDTGRMLPEGILVIESRVDDILNVGGVKVDPAEIEAVLALHPDVVEAAVFASKAPDGSDRLFAAVVLRGAVDEQALIQYCRTRTGLGVPRRIVAVRDLPRNAMGKIVRHELAEHVRAEIHAAGTPASAGKA